MSVVVGESVIESIESVCQSVNQILSE